MTVVQERLEGATIEPEASPAAAGPAGRTPRRAKTPRWQRLIAPLALFAVIVAGWEGLSLLVRGGRAFLVPSPWSVLTKGLLARDAYTQILPSFLRTAELAGIGLVVAIALGMAVGAVLYRFRWLERASFPYLVALQAVPVLAVAPLMAVAFGYSFFAKGIIVVMIAFFPIPTSFLLGLRSVDQGLDDMFRLHQVGWITRFRKLAFPNALPNLLTGFRISAGLAVVGAIVGEEFFQYGSPGLGMRLLQYLDQVEYHRLYGCLILSSILGVAFFMFFTWLSRKALGSWHESVQTDR
jgi:NitT/TauT family transport system permease protein